MFNYVQLCSTTFNYVQLSSTTFKTQTLTQRKIFIFKPFFTLCSTLFKYVPLCSTLFNFVQEKVPGINKKIGAKKY